MVPLKPNELRRDVDKTTDASRMRFDSIRGAASTGAWNGDDDAIDARNRGVGGAVGGDRHQGR